MTDTKELLQRISALRMRLNQGAEAAAPIAMRSLEEKVKRGAEQHSLIEGTLRSAEPSAPAAPALLRLTGRGARVLRKGRDLLLALRKIADNAEFQAADESDTAARVHREAMAMLDILLRTAQTFPPTISVQLRMCEGLEVILTEVENRIELLCNLLTHRKHTSARINELAAYLQSLASMQPVGLAPLQALADAVLADVNANLPLRFLYASPADPARFAAAHSLTVAHVLARVLMNDAEWQPQLQLALMAALVHDVGMVRVPAEILLTAGPLDADERRLIEKHTTIAEGVLAKLWPGGGWPVEAARDHHERHDGAGYPLGQRGIQISPYVHLLAACDVYAALGAPRPHRPAFDTRAALTETLLLAERNYLDQASAERLLLLSFYPVGSVVELNDGAIAMVIGTHAGDAGMTQPGRPIVQIALDAHSQAPAWPTIVDLLAATDRSIVRGLRPDERVAYLGNLCPNACV